MLFSNTEVSENASEDIIRSYVAGYFAKRVESVFKILDYSVESVIVVGTYKGMTNTFEGRRYRFLLTCRAQTSLSTLC